MSSGHPLVSIYIPTRNRYELLERAVASCLQQSYTNIEILVVDDGSDAVCQQQIAALCATDPRIQLLRQSPSGGAPAARNRAIAQAAGEYLTGLDDDDEFLPHRIESFVQAARQFPHADFFCSGYQYILPSQRRLKGMNKSMQVTLSELLRNNVVGNQIFARSALFRQIGGFDQSLQSCQDYDLWFRLCTEGACGLRLNNTSYVVHQEHEYERISVARRRIIGHQQFIDKHRQLLAEHGCLQYQVFLQALLGGEARWWTLFMLAPLSAWPLLCKSLMVSWLARRRSGPSHL